MKRLGMEFTESQAERAALAITARALAREAGYGDGSGVVKETFNSAVSGLLEDGLISNSTAVQVSGEVEDPLAGHARVSVRDAEGREGLTRNAGRGDASDSFPALSANERIEETAASSGPSPGAANAGRSDEFPALQAGERIDQRGD